MAKNVQSLKNYIILSMIAFGILDKSLVSLQGSFRNLGRIRMKPFQSNQTIIESNGNLYGDGEVDDEGGRILTICKWVVDIFMANIY